MMKTINKLVLVICHLYTTSMGEQLLYLEIAVLFLFIGTGFTRIFLIPHYSKLIDWMTRVTELITGTLFLLMILAQSIKHDPKICLIGAMVMVPGILITAYLTANFRS